MIRVLFVVDGPKDQFIVPPIARNAVNIGPENPFHIWKDLRVNKGDQALRGYESKLSFAMRLAVDSGLHGVVATVDTDKDKRGDKLRRLRNGRVEQRNNGITTPAALGEATPHAEAWLIDDSTAVRSVLRVPEDRELPVVTAVLSPKEALDELIAVSSVSHLPQEELLQTIAAAIDPKRCEKAKATGLRAFIKDLRDEYRAARTGDDDAS